MNRFSRKPKLRWRVCNGLSLGGCFCLCDWLRQGRRPAEKLSFEFACLHTSILNKSLPLRCKREDTGLCSALPDACLIVGMLEGYGRKKAQHLVRLQMVAMKLCSNK